MLTHEALIAAGLLRPGALVNYHYRLKLPEGSDNAAVKARVQAIGAAFPTAGWRIRDRSDASPSMRRFIERLGLFLTLVGLTALVVGGVGVGNAITAYLQKRRETIAVIKALAHRPIYFLHLCGANRRSVLSCFVARSWFSSCYTVFCASRYRRFIAGPIGPDLYPQPLLAAAGFGLLAAAARAMALGTCRAIPATRLFRGETDERAAWPAKRYMFGIILCFVGLGALAMLISERRDVALWFGVGVALSYLAGLRLVYWCLARRADVRANPNCGWRCQTSPSQCTSARRHVVYWPVRDIAFRHLHGGWEYKRANQRRPARTHAELFLMDVALDQIGPLMATMKSDSTVSKIESAPMLRGQILSVKGVPSAEVKPHPDAAWVLRGDRGLTYAKTMLPGASLVEGEWWPEDYAGPLLVSFDADEARGLGFFTGDEITVNVLGRPLTAKLANMRVVDWASGG